MQTSWGLLPQNRPPMLVGLACYTWLGRGTAWASSPRSPAAVAGTLEGHTPHSSL